MLKFKRKNKVCCTNVSMWRVLYEYTLWVLAGKPDNHKVRDINETL